MDATKLISFLGYSSIYPPFDDFLLENGIKKRPKKNEASESITDKATGITLRFEIAEIYDKENLFPKKSDGRFILSWVTFPRNFDAPMPFGLSLELAKDDINEKIGSPRQEHKQIPSALYFYDNYVIIINWRKEDPKSGFIRFTLPNIYNKEDIGL